MLRSSTTFVPVLALLVAGAFTVQAASEAPSATEVPSATEEQGDGASAAGGSAARRALEDALGAEGVVVDWDAGALGIAAEVIVREDLLEYLLVAPNGQAHESLFATDVPGSVLNAGLLGLGATPGRNARVVGAEDERKVELPEGDGFHLYAAWREADETYFFRVEDLLANLDSGRSMRRHAWVFLGSRFLEREGETFFAADQWGNLINVSFFYEGNTVLTGALASCESQTSWVANAWLVPPTGSRVLFVCSREPLTTLPGTLAAAVPQVDDGRGSSRAR